VGNARKLLMGLAGMLPMVGVLAVSLYLVFAPLVRGRRTRSVLDAALAMNTRELWVLGGAVLLIALVQMAVALAYILHAARDPRIGSGARMAWCLLMLFVGELAMPVYWLLYVYRDPPVGFTERQLKAHIDAHYPIG
jgi:hypothetical protein